MEKKNNSLREQLLSRLPQPENLASYREEVSSLMAKHEKALFWEKFAGTSVGWLGFVVFLVITFNRNWFPKLDTHGAILLYSLAGFLVFAGSVHGLGIRISRSKVDLLKEVKQVQLQVLELEAAMKEMNARQSYNKAPGE